MNCLRINQRRVQEIELSRWVEYFLNDALTKRPLSIESKKCLKILAK